MLILYYVSDQVGQASVFLANCNTSLSQLSGRTGRSVRAATQSSFSGPSFQVSSSVFGTVPYNLFRPLRKKPLLTPSLQKGTHAQVFLGFSGEWRSASKFL